jgi:hypothetical protein
MTIQRIQRIPQVLHAHTMACPVAFLVLPHATIPHHHTPEHTIPAKLQKLHHTAHPRQRV